MQLTPKLARLEDWWQRRSLLEIVLLAFALRLALAALAFGRAESPQAFHLEDTDGYIELASSLYTTGTFSAGGHPDVFRTPGYPLFLLPGVAAGRVEAVTIGLQIALSCITVGLVYQLALRVFGNRNLAKLAAVLFAVEPLSLLFCCKVMSETLFTFLIVAFLLATTAYLSHARWSALIAAAIALGAAIVVRPVAYYLPLAMGAGFLLTAILTVENRRLRLVQAVLFVFMASAPAWAWQLRNEAATGYHRFAAVEDVNLYVYNAASVLAAQRGIPLGEQITEMGLDNPEKYLDLRPEQRQWPEVDRFRYMRREAIAVLRHNLGTYLVIHISGVAPLLFGGGASELVQLLGLDNGAQDNADRQFNGLAGYIWNLLRHHADLFCYNVLLSGVAVAILGAAALGLVSRQTPRGISTLLLLCVALYFVVLSAGPSGRPRYRHPIMPIACLFASPGLVLLSKRAACALVALAPDANGTLPA
jgi:4-amino-4-deoxy-L-arabinose transferase-like glycosyltransferase